MRINGHIDTGGAAGASLFGTLGAGGAVILGIGMGMGGGATLGGGGSGITGGAAAGILGMAAAGMAGAENFPARAAARGACSASTSPDSSRFAREMICV